jgi:hypothetical protein
LRCPPLPQLVLPDAHQEIQEITKVFAFQEGVLVEDEFLVKEQVLFLCVLHVIADEEHALLRSSVPKALANLRFLHLLV